MHCHYIWHVKEKFVDPLFLKSNILPGDRLVMVHISYMLLTCWSVDETCTYSESSCFGA